MKKTLRFIAVAAILMLAVAVTAMAHTVSYNLVEYNADANEYDLVIDIICENDEIPTTFATRLELNTDVVGPLSTESGYITAASITVTEGRNQKTYSYSVTDEAWTIEGTTAKLLASCTSADFGKFGTTVNAMLTIPLKIADGKTPADITADDFKIATVYLGTSEDVYGVNEPTVSNPIGTIENNVAQEPVAPATLTIPVAAGDIVYLQDGTYVVVAEANEAFEIPATNGLVVVNSGYEAQKVYTVADGAVIEDTAKADGVLATGEASIRDDEVASGLRFKSTFLTALKGVVTEYGYITTVESAYNALPEGYVLDMALVSAGKAVKDVAYDGETDIFWNVEDDKTVVTAVVTNVPMTKEGVTTNVVIRPYYLVNGITVYGEPMTRTVYEVALNIKTNDAETYAKYQEYIDEIIDLVDGADTDVVIDFGPLFK